MRSCLGAPRSFRSFCGLPVHRRDRHGTHRHCRFRNLSRSTDRLVGSLRGRLLGRALEWCCCPISELWPSCIPYDRCRRRLVSCQSWIRNLTRLEDLVKAEREQPADEHADSQMECDGRPSFLRLRMHAHDAQGTGQSATLFPQPCARRKLPRAARARLRTEGTLHRA
jgi:hypothetical protein